MVLYPTAIVMFLLIRLKWIASKIQNSVTLLGGGGGRVGGRGFERLLGNRIESIRMQRTGHSTANEWPVSRSCRFRLMPRSTAQRCNLATPAKASEQKSMGVRTLFFFGIFFSPILFFASANLRNCKMAAGGGGGGGDDDDDGDGCIWKKKSIRPTLRGAAMRPIRKAGVAARGREKSRVARVAAGEPIPRSLIGPLLHPPPKKGRTMTSF